jgi:hypothetical protein
MVSRRPSDAAASSSDDDNDDNDKDDGGGDAGGAETPSLSGSAKFSRKGSGKSQKGSEKAELSRKGSDMSAVAAPPPSGSSAGHKGTMSRAGSLVSFAAEIAEYEPEVVGRDRDPAGDAGAGGGGGGAVGEEGWAEGAWADGEAGVAGKEGSRKVVKVDYGEMFDMAYGEGTWLEVAVGTPDVWGERRSLRALECAIC